MLKQRLIFAVIMSLVLSSMMTGWVTYLNLGLVADFLSFWLSAFLSAWPAAALIAFICGPEVQKLAKYLAEK